jgi:hypothetical protein
MADSKSGGGTSATAEKQQKTDTALKQERGKDVGDRYGGDEPLPYPETEVQDSITYRDPRPLDWPQKADRSVFIGAVHSIDADDDGSEKKGYVYAGKVAEDEELQLGGTGVETAQVVSGSGQLVLILDGKAFNLSGLGGVVSSDLAKGLEYNANS